MSPAPEPPVQTPRVAAWLQRAHLPAGTTTQPLPGDASARRYVRVTPPDRPPVMLLVYPEPQSPAADLFLSVGSIFASLGIPVPDVLGHAADLGIIVLEDLGDTTLQDYLVTAGRRSHRDRYLEAIDLVDRMQRRGLDMRGRPVPPFTLAFDIAKLMWELEFFIEHFLTGHRSARLDAGELTCLREELQTLSRELAKEPRVLCHRDFHSRNLMWHGGTLRVIDFQDARMGPTTYDLVSLLRDCYVDQEEGFVEDMLEAFRRVADPARTDDLERRFDSMSVQRHLKALGTFGFQASHGNARYLDDVPRTLGYLREVLTRHARFERLRSVLARALPELS